MTKILFFLFTLSVSWQVSIAGNEESSRSNLTLRTLSYEGADVFLIHTADLQMRASFLVQGDSLRRLHVTAMFPFEIVCDRSAENGDRFCVRLYQIDKHSSGRVLVDALVFRDPEKLAFLNDQEFDDLQNQGEEDYAVQAAIDEFVLDITADLKKSEPDERGNSE